MTGPNLAETVVDYLISQKVRHIFGVLAHTLFPIGDAIAKRPELRFINTQHE
ncbi:MAG: thiamine pyrophosphate-binding protein, partial [Candidatus Binatia bacterium]